MASKIAFLILHILSYGLSTYLSLRKEKGVTEMLETQAASGKEIISN